MGILNVTPDSFFDGGRYKSIDTAVERAERMIRDGADVTFNDSAGKLEGLLIWAS